jgi:Iodothyronine deiodinase
MAMRLSPLLRFARRRILLRREVGSGLLVLLCLGTGVVGALVVDRVVQRRERAANAACPPSSVPVFAGVEMSPEGLMIPRGMTGTPPQGTFPGIREGEPAPDFTLPSLREEREVRLGGLHKDRPAVLLFGSLTCDLFCGYVPRLERLRHDYQGRAKFLFVNVQEAGHRIKGLDFFFPGGVSLPNSSPERRAMVRRAMALEKFTWPAVIDRDDGQVARAYGGFPLRLVIVDTDGRIVKDLGQAIGRSWNLDEVEDWLKAIPPARG